MSIGQEDMNMPGGMQEHDPSLETTTLVGYVASNASLALQEEGVTPDQCYQEFYEGSDKNPDQNAEDGDCEFLKYSSVGQLSRKR